MSKKKRNKITGLYDKIIVSELLKFPRTGKICSSSKLGVYIIYQGSHKVLYVGNTPRGKNGLNQRLYNHITGSSSFSKNYLKHHNIDLRKVGKYRHIEVVDPKERAYLEALTIGNLCPDYIR